MSVPAEPITRPTRRVGRKLWHLRGCVPARCGGNHDVIKCCRTAAKLVTFLKSGSDTTRRSSQLVTRFTNRRSKDCHRLSQRRPRREQPTEQILCRRLWRSSTIWYPCGRSMHTTTYQTSRHKRHH